MKVRSHHALSLGSCISVAAFLLVGHVTAASDSSQARVTRIIRDVKLLPSKSTARPAAIDDLRAAYQPVGGVHRNRAHGVFAKLLRHFEHQGLAAPIDVQRRQDLRELTAVEADVDDRSNDLSDRADAVSGHV